MTFDSIVTKISDGLNFFDFSYFISGFMTYVTILYFVHELFGKELVGNVWLLLVVSIVFCYALGVLSYSLGKRIRMKVLFGKDGKAKKYFNSLSFEELFDKAKKDNFPKMSDEERKKMLSEDSGVAYSMMWMMVREKDKEHKDNRECDVFYPFLFRQWVMQAVCEGLCFSFLLMALLAVVLLIKMPEKWMYVMVIVGALIAMKASAYEARRFAENQIKELVIAYKMLVK